MVINGKYIAVPPGETIKEQLEDRNMTQKEFALRMGASEKHISKLVNGDVQLTTEMAYKLETVLGIDAEFWMKLESLYREKLLRIKEESSIEDDKAIARLFPYKEMSDLGWIPATRDAGEKALNLRRYFEVVELSKIVDKSLSRMACRRLKITNKGDLAVLAWAQKAKLESRQIDTSPIDIGKLKECIPEIKAMTRKTPESFSERMVDVLRSCGIALIYLPHLKGSYLQGATFLDNNKIVLGITARGKSADKFWFSLFHEFAHIVHRDLKKDDGTTDQDERLADLWAANTLISEKAYKQFIAKKDFSKAEIIDFSDKVGISPGIVVGRLQNDKLIAFNKYNDLKESYEIVCN